MEYSHHGRALLVNLALALGTRYHYRRKLFTCVRFYIWILFSAMVPGLSGLAGFLYLTGPALLIIIWFAFIPFSFSRQVLH